MVGRAEDVLPDITSRLQDDEVVAVVDPPRAGLRKYALNFCSSRYIVDCVRSVNFSLLCCLYALDQLVILDVMGCLL